MITFSSVIPRVDGQEFARTLADRLVATPPSIPVWLDKREMQPGMDWDQQIVEALRTCAGLLFLMTGDSVTQTPNADRNGHGP